MKRISVAISLIIILCILGVQREICLGQPPPPFEITYAGVTHVVGQRDVRTFFDLGINDLPSSVSSAYVKDPDNEIVHVFSPIEFSETYNGYFYAKPGPPKVGNYEFIVQFTDGTTDNYIELQNSVNVLPVMEVGQVTVDGNHTTTPTFTWENISPGNFYRLTIYDQFWNSLYRTSRMSDTAYTVPDGQLPAGINLRVRLEVHDSANWSTLENRSNGETLYLDTKYIPFHGVTHVNSPEGVKTNFDLGINFSEDSVDIASVSGPSFYYEFQDSDFLPEYNSYFKQFDGPPVEGDYIFTVLLKDGTSQSETDTQGPLETLPIIPAGQYEIIGGDGVTPTFRWPEVTGRILFYRAQIYDSAGNMVVSTPRLGGTAFVTSPGDLQPQETYEFVVETHDSSSFFTLNNQSIGQRLQFTTGNLPGPPSGQLKVISVPWVATAPLIPHDTYNGKEITFKAIARGGDGTYDYEWDFDGDGVYDFSSTTQNQYDLSAKHTYPDQLFDRIFIARIRVTSGEQIVTAEYPVRVHVTATQAVKVNIAIDEALWWMHQHMLRYDSGPVQYGALTGQMLGSTGAAVQAWENQGHKPGGDFENNPYVEDVRRGMNFILSKTNPYPIYTEDGRNPDTLVNGYGLHSIYESQLYETGIVIMALASSGDPNLTCDIGGFGLLGRKYGEIAQDMVDFLAFAQNEPDVGVWRGGWRYGPNYSQSDMSVTQWPVIGLEAVESEPNFGPTITVPQYVKDELAIYLGTDQDPDGGFGYTSPGGNVARTGAGIACLAWIGAAASDPRVISAMDFLNINWPYDNMGNLYAMYAVMKGMRGFEPDIDILGGHDWYAEYADFLIQNQYGDGSWTSDVWYGRDLATASGILILTPEIFLSPPVAVARANPTEATPGTVITFDHSGSFHRDPNRTLVAFRWDFNEDDIWDFETDDINSKPTWIYDDQVGCGDEVVHLADLEVEDDVGNTDADDETVIIRINLNNHPPVADGDPTDSFPNYYVLAGGVLLLDASQSYDPDQTHGDLITMWEWDLDSDGIFEASGETLQFQIPGNWEPGSIHTVTLRVTDDGSWASECGGEPNLTDETTILIAVGEGPDCSQAMPSISKLWPPNHKMVEIDVLGVTSSQGEPVEITIIGITQDEPVNGLGDGDTSPDGMGVGASTAKVRAERSGTGNGQVYEISFVAVDESGAECVGSVNVSVPHSKKKDAIDDGQYYDSTWLE